MLQLNYSALQRPIKSQLSLSTATLASYILGPCLGASLLLAGNQVLAQPVWQGRQAHSRMDDRNPHHYAIPAAELGASLGDFANQSGLLLSFDPELTRGRTAPALHGRYSAAEALRKLLQNTDLDWTPGPQGSYLLYSRSQTSGAASELEPSLVSADPGPDPKLQSYSQPQSLVYRSSEEIQRFAPISAGDLLTGIPGVQVGDARNGGALDVNIRGIQGQSRVEVTVDGSQQALDVYRGYAGTQQRSYIDPELISSLIINKGPSTKSGAIGGSVQMQTLQVQDILAEGKSFGVRLTGDLWNNGIEQARRNPRGQNQSLDAQPRDSRGSQFGAQAHSGSTAIAFSNDNFDVLGAYAQRQQGNYFAGKKGQNRYRSYDKYGKEEKSVATVYQAGEEVLNTSSKTESWLFKGNWRITEEQSLELSYRSSVGHYGEIMPSDIFRYGTAGIYQYPQSKVQINAYGLRYHYLPADNPLLDLSASLWMTDSKTRALTSVSTAPKSQYFRSDRRWTRQDNQRIGGELSNLSKFSGAYGELSLELGSAFQLEDLQPQKSVLTTQHDINANRTLRDGSRQEFSFNTKLTYQPVERLSLWGAGRYSHYRIKDNSIAATASREDREVRFIRAQNANQSGYLLWYPDQNGQYSDASDPRLNNGIVFEDSNNPFEGVPFNQFGATGTTAYAPRLTNLVTGYSYSGKSSSSGGAFAPSFGSSFELTNNTLLYASYTQGIRLPSLFEISRGTQQVDPGKNLKPEHSRSLEIGISSLGKQLLTAGDEAAFKLAYFDNKIKNYITRYYDPNPDLWGQMTFSNTDSYRTRGIELQSSYDAGSLFADLSATYYLQTETCDAAFAATLRAAANRFRKTENTPNCTSGSFMGSYSNTQNPPRLASSLTGGLRFFDRSLTAGARITYSSGPTASVDKPWQMGDTTPQIKYQAVTLFDLFANYQLLENTEVKASLQNLTDRYYLDPLAQSLMPAPGRTLRLGVSSRF